ncbi:MAG: hypothetical protein B6I20_11465 [Bacteroidetes bacterium 4572_117]|nr:MAG: hypothetical protein B6I20_11465 [Bacteroidetes bacterium 4572_117]
MKTDYFLKDPEIQAIIQRANNLKKNKKKFSNIVDGNGHQYVDLVQEGGGVLGIALIGYTYVLEQTGIRFFNLAGASAGAINTLLMASVEDISKEKSKKILAVLSEQNLFDFVDGGKKIKKIIKRYTDDKSLISSLIYNFFLLKRKIVDNMGLNPGLAFENWMREKIGENGISSLTGLNKRLAVLPELFYNVNGQKTKQNYSSAKIAVIATDATTKTKVEFPQMANLYWDPSKKDVNPACFVRASMSIPFFFEPFTVSDIPAKGEHDNPMWDDLAGYHGTVPDEIKFVDGGLLSNFPINIFHLDGLPKKPTFGAMLSAHREQAADTKSFGGFIGGMFDAIRQQFDFDFLFKHPDYQYLICKIDANKSYNWLDFDISDENKLGLFKLGATRAIDFLEKFDWENYQEIRK